jgi:membrane associated rhomboid family serine protease
VTIALIALNAALFVVAAASPRLTSDSYMVPAAVQAGQWDRLFASFFVTNNVPDVALNMFSLLIIGRLVEPSLGKWRYLALYMLSGLGGSVASYLFSNPLQPSAGASGAIFGLFGAYFVLARRAALNTSGILSLIVINLVFSFVVPDINWLAHLGGLATGLVVAAGYGLARRRRQQRLVAVLTVVSVCAVLCLLLLLTPGQVVLLN